MFHAKEGWYFGRLEDGSVRIITPDPAVTVKLDPDLWASAVASVSAQGDTAEAFQKASELHKGDK